MPYSEFDYRSGDEWSDDPDKTPVMGIPIIDAESIGGYEYMPSFGERLDRFASEAKDRWRRTNKTKAAVCSLGAISLGVVCALAVATITGSSEKEPAEEGSTTTTEANVPVLEDQPAGIVFLVNSVDVDGQTLRTYQCNLTAVSPEDALSYSSSVEHFIAFNPNYFAGANEQERSQRIAELLNGFAGSFDYYRDEHEIDIQQVPVLNGNFPNVSYEEPVMDIRNCQSN